jgi:hypothetical protein
MPRVGDAVVLRSSALHDVLLPRRSRRLWPSDARRLLQRGAGPLLRGGLGARATPDIVFRRADPPEVTFPLLVEVKYKPSEDRPKRDDLNQAISYGAAYASPAVVLVQPSGAGPRPTPLAYLGEVANMRMYQYAMNLAADLGSEEQQLADALEGIATLT